MSRRRLHMIACLALALGCGPCSSGDDAGKRLAAVVKEWDGTPYLKSGTDRQGIAGPAFVQAVYAEVFEVDLPAGIGAQLKTGRLVHKTELAPGDLVFFEGKGFGPFKKRRVGLFLGDVRFATVDEELGVTVQELSAERWLTEFKTARRIPTDPDAARAEIEALAAKSGGNRAELLWDIARAWKGTLYLKGGDSWEGIDNSGFVKAVYEAVHEVELDGSPKAWASMGEAVDRDDVDSGDILVYKTGGLGALFGGGRHAGICLGDGQFAHALKGEGVVISDLGEPPWQEVFEIARRIDPEVLAKQQAEAAARAAARAAERGKRSQSSGSRRGAPGDIWPEFDLRPAPLPFTQAEVDLRTHVADWEGTPYKIGGTSKSGIDCSAFVQTAYKSTFDVDLPRTAKEQERLGQTVSKEALLVGDLVFFRTQGMGPFFRSRHVGVYLGDGEFAHASGSRGVTRSRLADYYWNRKYETARRLDRD